MDLGDGELEEELEMLPNHSTPRNLAQSKGFTGRYRCGITFFLSVVGVGIVYYLLWGREPFPPPPIGHGPDGPPLSHDSALFPGHDPVPLSGHDPVSPPIQDSVWPSRAASVKDAFLHAYGGYERYTTFPDDELRPVSNSGQRNFNGWAVTVVDSLDTMWLMGLKSEFDKAVAQVATLDFTKSHSNAPFFETAIRYLGGLLSAYALSDEPILLARADELGRRLLPVFDSPSGLPHFSVDVETGVPEDAWDRRGHAVLAELGSCQLEYKYLSHTTGKEDYFQKSDHVMNLMRDGQMDNGMWGVMWNISSGKQSDGHLTVAAAADSTYEYVLKQYLLSGKSETKFRDMFLKATSGIIRNLLFLSPTRHLLYISDIEHGQLTRKFEHLACFFPGLLALAASTLDLPESEHQLYMWAAEGLGHSCWLMYADQASGLGPELVRMDAWPGDWKEGLWIEHVEAWQRAGSPGGKPPGVRDLSPPVTAGEPKDYRIDVSTYLSRPETLESMFVMWRTTRDVKWREHGWTMWEDIEKNTRTSSGYASVQGVDQPNPYKIDSMPSYFLAETIKYVYLLAIDEDPWPVDKFVLNTEAHPLPIFNWRDWEKRRYGVV